MNSVHACLTRNDMLDFASDLSVKYLIFLAISGAIIGAIGGLLALAVSAWRRR